MIKAILCSVLILFFTAGCKVVDEPKKEKPTEEQKVIDLFTAVNDGKINDVNKILKKGDTDVNGYNELGQTPVMVAVLSESPLIATALIKAGAKIYKPEKK